jgi:hypothetical protein
MKVEALDCRRVDAVVLNQFALLQIENLNTSVLLSDANGVVILVPTELITESFFVFETVDQLTAVDIEYLC